MAKVNPTAETVTHRPERSPHQFFVICKPGKAKLWRAPSHSGLTIEDVLETNKIFCHKSRVKGEPDLPTQADLENAFGTGDRAAIAGLIVESGSTGKKIFGGDERANLYKTQPRKSSSFVHQ